MEPAQKLPPLPPLAERMASTSHNFFGGWPCYLCHFPYLTRSKVKRIRQINAEISRVTVSETFIEFHCQLPEHKRVYHSQVVCSTAKCWWCAYSPSD